MTTSRREDHDHNQSSRRDYRHATNNNNARNAATTTTNAALDGVAPSSSRRTTTTTASLASSSLTNNNNNNSASRPQQPPPATAARAVATRLSLEGGGNYNNNNNHHLTFSSSSLESMEYPPPSHHSHHPAPQAAAPGYHRSSSPMIMMMPPQQQQPQPPRPPTTTGTTHHGGARLYATTGMAVPSSSSSTFLTSPRGGGGGGTTGVSPYNRGRHNRARFFESQMGTAEVVVAATTPNHDSLAYDDAESVQATPSSQQQQRRQAEQDEGGDEHGTHTTNTSNAYSNNNNESEEDEDMTPIVANNNSNSNHNNDDETQSDSNFQRNGNTATSKAALGFGSSAGEPTQPSTTSTASFYCDGMNLTLLRQWAEQSLLEAPQEAAYVARLLYSKQATTPNALILAQAYHLAQQPLACWRLLQEAHLIGLPPPTTQRAAASLSLTEWIRGFWLACQSLAAVQDWLALLELLEDVCRLAPPPSTTHEAMMDEEGQGQGDDHDNAFCPHFSNQQPYVLAARASSSSWVPALQQQQQQQPPLLVFSRPLEDDDEYGWEMLQEAMSLQLQREQEQQDKHHNDKVSSSSSWRVSGGAAMPQQHPLARLCVWRGRAYYETGHVLRAAVYWKRALTIDGRAMEAYWALLDHQLLTPWQAHELIQSLNLFQSNPSKNNGGDYNWLKALYLTRIELPTNAPSETTTNQRRMTSTTTTTKTTTATVTRTAVKSKKATATTTFAVPHHTSTKTKKNSENRLNHQYRNPAEEEEDDDNDDDDDDDMEEEDVPGDHDDEDDKGYEDNAVGSSSFFSAVHQHHNKAGAATNASFDFRRPTSDAADHSVGDSLDASSIALIQSPLPPAGGLVSTTKSKTTATTPATTHVQQDTTATRATDPMTASPATSLASALQSDVDEAFDQLHNLYKLPNSPQVLAMSAQRAYRRYQWKQVLHYCERLAQIDPTLLQPGNSGSGGSSSGFSSSMAHCGGGSGGGASRDVAYVYVAALLLAGHKRTLFDLAHKWVEAQPQQAASWFAVGAYYSACGRPHVAQRHYCRATRLDPQCTQAWIAFGCAFAACDESDQALASFRAAQRLSPGEHTSLLYMGMEYTRTNHLILAHNFITTALQHSGGHGDPLCWHELGVLAMQKGKNKDAQECFQKVLSLVVVNTSSHSTQTSTNGNHTVSSLAELVELCVDPYWESTVFNLGHALRKLCRYNEARTCYARCIALCPDKCSGYSAFALVCQLLNETDVAVDYYHKALACQPDDSFATEMLQRALAGHSSSSSLHHHKHANGMNLSSSSSSKKTNHGSGEESPTLIFQPASTLSLSPSGFLFPAGGGSLPHSDIL